MEDSLRDQIMFGMIGDYLLLEAKMEAIQTLLVTLASALNPREDPRQVAKEYSESLRVSAHSIYEKKLASHRYLDEVWKIKLRLELGDIPGLFLD